MAQFENRYAQPGGATRTGVAIDEGLRSYMLGVYNYMAAGVALTGLVAVGYGADEKGTVGVKRHACVSITSAMCGFAAQRDQYGCVPGREMVLSDISGQGRDTCIGDSGGPVFAIVNSGPVYFYYLVGITSRGANRGRCGQGGIYSLLTPGVVEWIRNQGVVLSAYPYPEQ